MGGLEDAGVWGLAWAMLAAAVGSFTTVVAAARLTRAAPTKDIDYLRGYDATSPALRPPAARLD